MFQEKENPLDFLPSPQDLFREFPANDFHKGLLAGMRTDICRILDGSDSRMLLVVGPCSIHDPVAAKEYAVRLRRLADSVSDVFYILMRAYFEKPRTSIGWKGLMYDPWLDGSYDIASGMRLTRQLLLELVDLGIAPATELLDPTAATYFGDLIAWACIGARTAASQTHRQMSSGLTMPVGFKNSTDGNVKIAINGILAASHPHSFIGINTHGQSSLIRTKGNPNTHLVLRGGERSPNYDPESISAALKGLESYSLPQRLLVDCSHDNSYRQHDRQVIVFQSVLNQFLEDNRKIRGVLLESNLEEGRQSHRGPLPLQYGVSVTDSCLSWKTTEQLILWGYDLIRRKGINRIQDMVKKCADSSISSI